MMSPRNIDNTTCKDKLSSGESQDSQLLDFSPNILHKKHKVIKLVQAQLLKLQEEGFIDYNHSGGGNESVKFQNLDYLQQESSYARNSSPEHMESMENFQTSGTKLAFLWFIILLISTFLLILAATWLSAGPLSNRAPYTPIPWSSLVKTDGICELERKYLLRWSTSNFLE